MLKESDSKKQLEVLPIFNKAIQNLDSFVQKNAASSVPHLLNMDVEDKGIVAHSPSFIYRCFHVVRFFIKSLFSSRQRIRQEQKSLEVQQELLRSVVTVKKHYMILDKMKDGCEEEQKLASLAHDVISRYNAVLHQAKKEPPTLKDHFVKFLYEKMGVSLVPEIKNNEIELPLAIAVKSVSNKKQNVLKMPSSLSSQGSKPNAQLTQKEMDAFCMKAITMIKNHAMPSISIREALSHVKTQPIQTEVDLLPNDEGNAASIVFLSQTLSIFPGEKIELQGSFKRDAHSQVMSLPISDSFQLISQSIQSGFPDPSQYHGWAFCDVLIPLCPLRLDRLPLLYKLLQQKKQIAIGLLPNGELITKAKIVLRCKKQAFDQNKKGFLELHQRLAETIITASLNGKKIPKNYQEVVARFFHLLEKQESPYNVLSETSFYFNECFLRRPLAKIDESWADERSVLHNQKDPTLRFTTSDQLIRKIFDKVQNELEERMSTPSSEFEHAMLSYVAMMGTVLSDALKAIILQFQSEKIEFAPPTFDDFTKLIHSWTFRQILSFHREWSMVQSEDPAENMRLIGDHMKRLVEADIAHFQTQDSDQLDNDAMAIVRELEDYYNFRI